MSVVEMCMLHWLCGNTRRDKVRNEDIRTKVGVAPIEEKIENTPMMICDVNLQMRQSDE